MAFNFLRVIEHCAYSRRLRAGTILGSGTFCNADRSAGSAKTPFLKFSERVKIEMLDASSRSIFGAIDQRYVPYRRSGAAP